MKLMSIMKKIKFRLQWEICKKFNKQKSKSKKYIKWGIVGLGNMADLYSKVLCLDEMSVIVSAASRDISKARLFAKKHNIARYYGSYNDFIENEKNLVDFVYIATPSETHFDYVKMFLENKFNVLCEKPMVYSKHQFEYLDKLAKSNDVLLIEAMWSNFLPVVNSALRWINSDFIGATKLIRVNFYKTVDYNNTDSSYKSKNLLGVLNDFAIYAFSMVSLFSKGMIISHSTIQVDLLDLGISDISCHLNFENMNACIDISTRFKGDSTLAIYGEKGYIVFSSPFNRTSEIKLYSSDNKFLEKVVYKYKYSGYEYQVKFINSLLLDNNSKSYNETKESTIRTYSIIDIIKDVDNAE